MRWMPAFLSLLQTNLFELAQCRLFVLFALFGRPLHLLADDAEVDELLFHGNLVAHGGSVIEDAGKIDKEKTYAL